MSTKTKVAKAKKSPKKVAKVKKTTKATQPVFINPKEVKTIEDYVAFLKSHIVVNSETITITQHRDNLLAKLRANKMDSKMCKSIRHELRGVCLHDGGTRTRKYKCRFTNIVHHVASK
jgi:late competence protein required for DNA uptake (superfamily II DNA/RNA helicase)